MSVFLSHEAGSRLLGGAEQDLKAAVRYPACSDPANSQFFLPAAMGRMTFSTGLLLVGKWSVCA